jgi:cytidine deaminase
VTDRELYERAVAIADRAYAKYSNYRVGAVALAKDGRVFEGVNVENAAYPLGMCAERVALSRAVVEGCGPGQIEAVAATASPCGGCRQWLFEFEVERVTFRSSDDRIVTYSARELLPETWDEL